MVVYLEWELIEEFVNKVFIANGVPKADAAICTDVLLDADKRGMDTHGVNRLKPIYIDRIQAGIQSAKTDWEIIRETPTTAVMDAHDGMGQVASYHAMKLAIKKAKEFGMGMVAVRNSTHYGTAGYYTEMAAAAGCIGMSGTNARPSIAPTFSVQNKLGTNPLAFAFPTDEDFPFSLDAATSIIQRGEVELRNRQGKDTPAGTVIGPDGAAMTDSAKILESLLDGATRGYWRRTRWIQRLWLCNGCGSFICRFTTRKLFKHVSRSQRRRWESKISLRSFFYGGGY